MEPVRLSVGTEWLLDGRAWRVVRQPSANRFVAQDVKFNCQQEFSLEELLTHYAQGRLHLGGQHAKQHEEESEIPTSRTILDLSPRERQAVEWRWSAIQPLTQLDRPPTGDDLQRRSEDLQNKGIHCSARSLRRYLTAWKKRGGDRLALLPRSRHCGGRGRSREHGLLRPNSMLTQLVEDAIRSVYLTTARRPISAVTRRVLEDLQRHNARRPADQALSVPREAALSRAIARRIAQLDPWEADCGRWGKRIADRRHAATRSLRQATRILQRVEIDHSPLKVVVGTEAGPIGQPWLTVLIDYYSRMIVGFCLGFDPPSYGVIMEALRHAILPKSHVRERYPKVSSVWPCYGLPERLVCDRGSDLISKDLEQAAFQLSIQLDFNPPRMPHFKGTVESFFAGLNDQLISSLPGRTFRSWEKRADHNADDGPLISYEGLLEVIHIHLVDVYAAGKHPTSDKTRSEMWQESAAEHPPCLPAAQQDLTVLLAKRAERTVSQRGLELGGMFYNSDPLMALRADLAAHNIDSLKLQVRYNPWDLGAVWVLNPVDGNYLEAVAADTVMQGMTEYQWKVLKRAIRQRFDEPEHLLSLAAGRNAIREVVEQTMKKPARKRRARAARFLNTSSALRPDEPALRDDGWLDVPPDNRVSSSAADPPPELMEEANESPVRPMRVVDEPAEIDPAELDVDDWDVACG